jgi:DNA-binding protein HU-beta
MRRDDLKRAVAKSTGLSDAQADNAVRAVFASIESALADGHEVTISGFGSFRVAERPARDGLHPQTRQPMKIEARRSPAFKPGARLKRAVNGEDVGDDEE